MDVKKILSEMTVNEKAALVAGTDFMYTNPIPRLGVQSIRMSDGPHGLRVQVESGDNGISESLPATSFPTAATTASGWDPENLRKMGEAIGDECRRISSIFPRILIFRECSARRWSRACSRRESARA